MFLFVSITFVLDVDDDDDDEPDYDYGDGDLGGDIGGCGEYCVALHAFINTNHNVYINRGFTR